MDLTAVLGGSPGKTGECGLLWGKGIGGKALGKCVFLWRWPFWENLAPPISKQAAQRTPWYTATSNLTQRQSPTHQRDRNQPHLPVGRHQPLPSGSLQQAPILTAATRGADTRSKRGYKKVTTPKIYKNEDREL